MYKMFVASQHSNIQEKAEIKTLQVGSLSDPYTFPTVDGTTNQILKTDGAGVVSWATDTSGTGDVVGASSAVSGAIPLFDGTTGKLLKDSGILAYGDIALASNYNFSIGDKDLSGNNAVLSTAIGLLNLNASASIAVDSCLGVGFQNLTALTSGLGAVATGFGILTSCVNADYCTLTGYSCGNTPTTGLTNCSLYGALTDAPNGCTNSICLGFQSVATASNQAMIGNASLTQIVPKSTAVCSLGSSTNPFTGLHMKTVYVSTSSTTLQAVINTEYYIDLTVNDVAITFPATATVGDYFKCTIIGKDADVDKATFVNGTMNVDGGSDDQHFAYHTLWKVGDAVSFKYVSSTNWISYDRNVANRFQCFAYLNQVQDNLTNGAKTKVNLNAVDYDYNGDFDTATNYYYTCPISGMYDIIGSTKMIGLVADKTYYCWINEYPDTEDTSYIAGAISVSKSLRIYLAQGSTIILYAQQNSGVSTVDLYPDTGTSIMITLSQRLI
jgi:hypothetical protein